MKNPLDLIFRDWLMVMLVFLVCILVMLIAILKTQDSEPAIKDLNKLVIRAVWPEQSKDDIDLWVRDPAGFVIGYPRKSANGMVLQYDDTGVNLDKVQSAAGDIELLELNYEQANIRQTIPGIYRVNLQLYSRRGKSTDPITASVTLIDVAKGIEKPFPDHAFTVAKQQRTMAMFEVLKSGRIRFLDPVQMRFAGKLK